ILYDYDFEGTPAAPHKSYCLSKFAYNCLQTHRPQGIKFEMINFTDMTRTRRINPFASSYIQDRAYLEEYVNVLLKNLVPEANKGKDFWLNSAQVLLKGLLVFLDNNYTQYCTLPHALALATQPITQVMEAIRSDEEARTYASAVFDALDAGDKAAAQLAGITSTLKVSLQLLLHPHLFWVLSGNQVPLCVNDAAEPMLLCIGNYPPAKASYSPIIALLITTCFKAMYGHGRVKSFVAIDELPTLFLPDLSELPATARKYGISTITCLQSNAQLEDTYGTVGAKKIQQTLVTKFIGNTEDASAVYGSQLVGKRDKAMQGRSVALSHHQRGSSETRGKSVHWQERSLLPPQALMRFAPGEFTGKVAEGNPPFFHAQLRAVSSYNKHFRNASLKELPVLAQVTAADIADNYERIWVEAKGILEEREA
ncbi:MAG: type IV secretory system conjugative DNA transfer family protein, partial [Cyanobacteria bacterium J06559_1]